MDDGNVDKSPHAAQLDVEVRPFPGFPVEVDGLQDGAAASEVHRGVDKLRHLVVAGVEFGFASVGADEEMITVDVHGGPAVRARPRHDVQGFEAEASANCGPVLKIRQ